MAQAVSIHLTTVRTSVRISRTHIKSQCGAHACNQSGSDTGDTDRQIPRAHWPVNLVYSSRLLVKKDPVTKVKGTWARAPEVVPWPTHTHTWIHIPTYTQQKRKQRETQHNRKVDSKLNSQESVCRWVSWELVTVLWALGSGVAASAREKMDAGTLEGYWILWSVFSSSPGFACYSRIPVRTEKHLDICHHWTKMTLSQKFQVGIGFFNICP